MNILNENRTATEYKNPLVIYHGNCADGFSAAWCFHHMQDKMEQAFDFHPGVYNNPPPDCEDRIVYLVDFSYRREVVKKICKVAYEVILIDHHKTAIDDLSFLIDRGSDEFISNFTWYVDINRSGAILAWDYLNNYRELPYPHTLINGEPEYVQPPRLLEHIQDRDLWKFKLAHTREISANVFSYEYTFENWDKLMTSDGVELMKMTVAGAAIERKHHKDIKELINVCQRHMVIGGYVVPVASLPYTLTSDAGALMASTHKEGKEFAACYWDTDSHRIFSLRSTEFGIDVSDIAKQYGGGGHKNAAGFRVSRDHELARC